MLNKCSCLQKHTDHVATGGPEPAMKLFGKLFRVEVQVGSYKRWYNHAAPKRTSTASARFSNATAGAIGHKWTSTNLSKHPDLHKATGLRAPKVQPVVFCK